MKTVGFIPVKLNNVRLPGKNTRELGGRALCSYLFDTVRKVHGLDEIYVICSDPAFQSYVPEGITFLRRPKELDEPTIKSKDILNWFTGTIDADVYALMHVTEPFIKAATIQTSVQKVIEEGYDSAFAAREIKEFSWYQGNPINYSFENVILTQNLEPVYVEGELYVFRKEVFTKLGRRIGVKPYIHPLEWREGICIDDLDDFEMAEAVLTMDQQKAGKGNRYNEKC